MVDREHARAAKSRLADTLRGNRYVNGVGLSKRGANWVIKVNLTVDAGPARDHIPLQVDGVQVVIDLIGPVRAQAS